MQNSTTSILRYVTGAVFVGAGAMHFLRPAPYLTIMPPAIPAPLAMVYISGVAEMAGGLGLCLPPTQRAASWGLAALLVAVFPANVYMAMSNTALPPALLWGRLPLQGVLIWWVVKMGRRN